MVVDVGLVNVGADDESVLALGESPGQLHAQPVGFLRVISPGTKDCRRW